jgi:hypothetical protein
MSLKEVFDQASVIEYLCSIQKKCKGAIATGTLDFIDNDSPISIPVCEECAQYVGELRSKRLTELGASGRLD